MTGIFTICILSLPDRGTPLGQRDGVRGTSGLAATGARPAAIRKDAAPVRCPGARKGIRFYHASTWRWQDQRDATRTRAGSALRSRSCAFVRWAAELWRDRAGKAREAFQAWMRRMLGPDWRSGKWGCIHGEEAAWNDANPPHYGGLQFDDDFQRTYGPEFFPRWGDAGGWPVWAQLIAAERAFHGFPRSTNRDARRPRGFRPWPNTARECGLL